MIRVHQVLGPGFVERVYHNALVLELSASDLEIEPEKEIVVRYRDHVVGKHRLDLVVGGVVVIELKTVDELSKAHYAQLRSYLKAANLHIGLLVNFAKEKADFRRVEITTQYNPSPPSP